MGTGGSASGCPRARGRGFRESFMNCEWGRVRVGAACPLASARGFLGEYGMASLQEAPGGNRGICQWLSPGLRPGFSLIVRGLRLRRSRIVGGLQSGRCLRTCSGRGILGWSAGGTMSVRIEPNFRPKAFASGFSGIF